MTYLPSLITKIDDFYSLTESLTRLKRMAQRKGYYMPDEPEGEESEEAPGPEGEDTGLYRKIVGVSDSLSNEKNDFKYEDIAHELQLIAELYKKALQINGGYHQMQEYIKRTMANIDMLIDDSEGVIGDEAREMSDDILEEISGDLRKRAKATPITQQMDEPTARQELKTVKDNFNRQEARQEMAEQKSVYEKGKPGQETGHGISARPAPETPEKYAREVARLTESLGTEKDPKTRMALLDLAQTINALLRQMNTTRDAADAVKAAPNDPEAVRVLADATQTLEQLRAKRQVLKRMLNNFLLTKDQEDLQAKLTTIRNPDERRWIEEQIGLLRLRQSNDLRKRDEIKARKALINSMGVLDEHGDFQSLKIPENEKVALQRAIQLGQDRKISKADYDRGRTEQKGKMQGRDYVPIGEAQRGGARRKVLKQMNFDKAAYQGMLKKLRDLNNTATSDARKYIMRPKEGGDPSLEPYVEAVSLAIRKRDNAGKYQAVNALREAVRKTLVASTSLKGYIQVLRMSPHFKRIEEALFSFKNKQVADGTWNLDDEDKQQLAMVISDMNRITDLYSKYYQREGARKFAEQPYAFFKGVVNTMAGIKEYVINNMLLGEPTPAGVRVEEEPAQKVRVSPGEEEMELPEEESEAKKRMRLMTWLIQPGLDKKGQKSPDPKERKRIYDRIRTIEKAKRQGKEIMLGKKPQRGGWSPYAKKNDYDYTLANFEGIVSLLQEKINTAIGTAKEKLTRPRSGGDERLKPYVDAVAKAAREGDRAGKIQALQILRDQVAQQKTTTEHALKVLEKSARLLPHFVALKEALKTISSWQRADNWSLTPKRISHIFDIIDKSRRLQDIYSRHYQRPGQLGLYFGKAVEIMAAITSRLQTTLEQRTSP